MPDHATDSAVAPPADSAWSRPTVRAGIVFGACFLIYLSNLRPLTQADCAPAPYAAWALVRHGTFDVGVFPDDKELQFQRTRPAGSPLVRLPDGRWVSKFPPGSTLAALPFIAPVAAVRAEPLTAGAMRGYGKFVAMAYAAAAAALFHLICLRLAPSAAVPATILFALGTCLWSAASQALWPHAPAVFFLTAAAYLCLSRPEGPTPGRAAWAGAALGMAVLTRPATALFALAAVVGLLWQRQWRSAAAMAAGGLPAAVLFGLYLLAYNNPLTAAGYDDSAAYATPWSVGLPGLLISPSRGLLVFSPALVLVPLGIAAVRSAGMSPVQRSLLVGVAVAAAATIPVYARWFEWWGGWCYGPRFLLETLPALCLLFALAYARLRRPLARRAADVLIGLSVAIHFAGVFGHPRDETKTWNARRLRPPVDTAVFFDWGDSQIEAHVRGVFGLRSASD